MNRHWSPIVRRSLLLCGLTLGLAGCGEMNSGGEMSSNPNMSSGPTTSPYGATPASASVNRRTDSRDIGNGAFGEPPP